MFYSGEHRWRYADGELLYRFPQAIIVVFCYWFLLLSASVSAETAAHSSRQLSLDNLWGKHFLQPLPMAEFGDDRRIDTAKLSALSGELELSFTSPGNTRMLKDSYSTASKSGAYRQLPDIKLQLISDAEHVIPLVRGLINSGHSYWDVIVEPGRQWREAGESARRIALPFSLIERNANCTHNGVMTFAISDSGDVSPMAYQISAETCAYFQLDIWGLAETSWTEKHFSSAKTTRDHYRQELSTRLPVSPIETLPTGHQAFSAQRVIPAANMTLYGLVLEGRHYVSGCQTRAGPYPFCEVMTLPSYSLAKSVMAGLALMRLEHQIPGSRSQIISKYVGACNSEAWSQVSVEHALDMTTGHYNSMLDRQDEWAVDTEAHFFIPEQHTQKIDYACKGYVHQQPPGQQWVYHTTDTYLVGTAMQNIWQAAGGRDLFDELVVEGIYKPLQLSQITYQMRRSLDETRQVFSGFGLSFTRDDIARLSWTLLVDNELPERLGLDRGLFEAALQRNPTDRGLVAGGQYRYNNGFWAKHLDALEGCSEETWLPFMTGYGGINVVLMPNDSVYYYFSDAGIFSWQAAAEASHKLKSFCTGKPA